MMKNALSKIVCLAVLIGAAPPQVIAADLGARAGLAASGVPVVVDDLFLRARRCGRNPDCIAPRVMPVVGDSMVRNESVSVVTIPVDPRFKERYLPQ